MARIAILSTLVIFYVLHQDFWQWDEARPLAFGVLPVGLAYHAGYTLVAAVLVYVLGRWGRVAPDESEGEP